MQINSWRESDKDVPVGSITVDIKYRDYDDYETTRKVDVHKVLISQEDLFIMGYCHKAKMEKYFRVSHIVSASINGEVIDPEAYFKNLINVYQKRDKASLEGINFCITGVLSIPRKKIAEMIVNLDGILQGGVSWNTHFLITNNPYSGSSKWKWHKRLEQK